MSNPERLVNNPLMRALVALGGVPGSRTLLGRGLLPLLLRPRKMRLLRARVAGHLGRYFPELGEAAAQARADAFVWHYRCKFAEDCVAVSTRHIERFRAMFDRHVVVEGLEHFHHALDQHTGILAVGSHVGSPTFGTAALVAQFLTVPRSRYRVVRLCAEPEAMRYPTVMRNAEIVLQQYGGDLSFIWTRRESKSIAVQMSEQLESRGLVTTNLDVLMGGGSKLELQLFDRAVVQLPALVGAAKAALRTGALLLPWLLLRTPRGFRLVLEPPLGPVAKLGTAVTDEHPKVLALVEQLRALLERWIVCQPEQWFYWDRFHKRLVRDEP